MVSMTVHGPVRVCRCGVCANGSWTRIGDVMHLTVLGKSLVILSSKEAIAELFEKRGSIYSDRPIIPMAGVL